jgi:hypothetical protein
MRSAYQLLIAAALLSSVACQSATMGAPVSQIPSTAIDESFSAGGVRRVAHAYYSGFDRAARLVVRDQRSWSAAWALLYAGSSPVPPVPAIDFSGSTVIVVALGARSTGGYDMTVTRVARDGAVLYVEATSTSPGRRCGTTQAFTQPVDIIVVPHGVTEAVFVERKLVHEC